MPAPLCQAVSRSNLWIDKFERAALGGTYSVVRGSADISGNECRMNTSGTWNDVMGIRNAASINQWLYTKFTAGSTPDGLWYFRFTDTSSPYYHAYYYPPGNQLEWQRKPNTAGGGTGVPGGITTSLVLSAGDALAFTLNGTGNTTHLRGFKNPTGSTPLSAAHWDSGDTPVFDFTHPGTLSVDTGLGLGFGGYPTVANGVRFSEVRWGAIVS